ncbi:MAG: hypothetical protein EP343_08305 [Deltaproteobacteria bacterium]|nr:MAG: hypothetical protein EP343_08305 [Deltaproteobacteria bacterium]
MRSLLFVLCCLAVSASHTTFAQAKSKKKVRYHRTFDRGSLKLVSIETGPKTMVFRWKSPSGKVIRYRAKDLHPGLRVKLLRYAKHKKPIALGGSFTFLSGNNGVVEPDFAYRVHRYWRGAMAVKFDGWMPLYKVTRLPTDRDNASLIYELRGRISSAMSNRDNKLVCIFGVWFDLLDYIHPRTQKRRGMLYQVQGIKGHSLFWFKPIYKHPRSWQNILNFKEKMAAFRAARLRRRKGLPPQKRVIRIPRAPAKTIEAYDKLCAQRLSAKEKNIATPGFVTIEPLNPSASRKAPTSRKAPASRPAPRR